MTEAKTLETTLYAGKAEKVTRVDGNRHFLKPDAKSAEQPQSLCNACGALHARRGYCTNCGSPA